MAKMLGTIKEAAESQAVITCVTPAELFDAVLIDRLTLGEVVKVDGDTATVRSFDKIRGVGRGDAVLSLEKRAKAELGPGLLCKTFDSLQRPLTGYTYDMTELCSLDRSVKWHFEAALKFGDRVYGGEVYGTLAETDGITHKICVPEGVSGSVVELRSGDYTVNERIGKIKRDDGTIEEVTLITKRDIKTRGRSAKRLPSKTKLDADSCSAAEEFPVFKGGSLCIFGGSEGARRGLEGEILSRGDFDISVNVCAYMNGRAFEGHHHGIPAVTFVNGPKSTDIAYERSLDLAMTVAEYYRDMGYSVALTVEDLTCIAEAMTRAFREGDACDDVGCRSRLRSRLLGWFERAGAVVCRGSEETSGDITLICLASASRGAVSEADLRQSRAFWRLIDSCDGLDIDPKESYSSYSQKRPD